VLRVDLSSSLAAWFASKDTQEHISRLLREALKAELAELLDGELLDVSQAAKLLSMTPGAVRKAVGRGSIPCVRIGRRLRFHRSTLLRISR